MAPIVLNSLVERGFNIAAVIPPSKNHETYKYFKEFVLFKGLKFLSFDNSINEPCFIEKIKELNADIGVVCSYNKLLSKEFLSSTKMGYINCHPSLLPDYRGACPYFHVINNGEKKSGVTLHFMDENFDTGDIIYQKEFEITPYETMGTYFNRTNYMFCDVLCEVLSRINNNEKIDRIKQEKTKEFIDAPRVDGNFRIRWNKNADEIERLIRASNPFYNVYTSYKGVSFKVIKSSLIEINCDFDFNPGEIVKADENYLIVAAQKGLLSLEIFQVGTWGVFNPKDFYYNFSPKPGEYLI